MRRFKATILGLVVLVSACGDTGEPLLGTTTQSPQTETPATAIPTSTEPSPAAPTAPSTTATTSPPATTATTATTAITSTGAPGPPPVEDLEAGLFCRDLVALGYDYASAVAYWYQEGKPDQMDADQNGIPCELVYPADEVAAVFAATAADALAGFFDAVRRLDAEIAAAALGFNSAFDPEGPSLDPVALPAIEALDAVPLQPLISPGMSEELELAVLAVYADLDSRIAALLGGVWSTAWGDSAEPVMLCLGNGSRSNARFDDDLARAERLAVGEPAPTAAPDSPAAGVLQVRLDAIGLGNWGCESCGGVEYDEPWPVDWEGRTVWNDVPFDVSFIDGRWRIEIAAC